MSTKFLNNLRSIRTLLIALFTLAASNISIAGDMNKKDVEAGMFTKVYWAQVDPDKSEAMFEHFDTVVVPMVKESEHHGGLVYQFVQSEPGKWLLVANYQSREASVAAAPFVGKLVGPMVEKFGMTLDLITEGDIHRLTRK